MRGAAAAAADDDAAAADDGHDADGDAAAAAAAFARLFPKLLLSGFQNHLHNSNISTLSHRVNRISIPAKRRPFSRQHDHRRPPIHASSICILSRCTVGPTT